MSKCVNGQLGYVCVCERVREGERGKEFLKWALREKKKTSGINNLGITCVVCVRKKKENNRKKRKSSYSSK